MTPRCLTRYALSILAGLLGQVVHEVPPRQAVGRELEEVLLRGEEHAAVQVRDVHGVLPVHEDLRTNRRKLLCCSCELSLRIALA